MRASRLLSILLLLQTRGRMTAEALAAEFEVSVRTIYRDIDHLSAADVPVYADRGPNGGYELLDGYRTRLTGLSPTEAATLFLAGLPGPAGELGLADVLSAAQLKLTAALPEAARATASRVSARFHLDPVGWFGSADNANLLPTIANAVWTSVHLEIQYKRYTKTVARRAGPLGLVLKGGVWYLVAEVGTAIRTYRIANILSVTVTDEHFERPKNFHLEQYWTNAARAYEAGLIKGSAVARVSPRGLRKLDQVASAVMRAALASADPPDESGWTQVTVPIESIDQGASTFLQLGSDAEVLEPEALRGRILQMAREVTRRYGA